MLKTDLENILVSYFPTKENKSTMTLTIGNALTDIQKGKYKTIINDIRRNIVSGQKEEAQKLKGALPAVTFSGLYPEYRRDGYCTQYNEIIVIDIDHLSVEKMTIVKEQLIRDPHVIALWQSPSGNGYKGLVKLRYTEEYNNIPISTKHRSAFRTLYTYMIATYGIELDRSGSDPTRLCFMSYDSDLIVKEEADDFVAECDNVVLLTPKSSGKVCGTIRIPTRTYKRCDWHKLIGQKWEIEEYKQNKQTLYSIYRKMKRKNISITTTFEEWVKVAYAIANSMHPTVGKEMFLKMCELDGVKHDPEGSEHLIYDAYCNNRGNVHFSTIIYIAKQKGVIGLV